ERDGNSDPDGRALSTRAAVGSGATEVDGVTWPRAPSSVGARGIGGQARDLGRGAPGRGCAARLVLEVEGRRPPSRAKDGGAARPRNATRCRCLARPRAPCRAAQLIPG